MDEWFSEEILITVRAYPEPSQKYIETSCVAGITSSGHPIRLFPVPARSLDEDKTFHKFSVIRAKIKKASDPRPESHRIDQDSIQVIGHIGTDQTWSTRNERVRPFRVAMSMEELWAQYQENQVHGAPSLALIRPRSLDGLFIEPKDEIDWTEEKKAHLSRKTLFDTGDRAPLEFIPYRFKYRFRCDERSCKGHAMSVVDWEMNQSYRSWFRKYGEKGWEEKFRQRYEHEFFSGSKDLQFFVGTMMQYPANWIVIGLYYPPSPPGQHQASLPF
jgi:hypothetical protein